MCVHNTHVSLYRNRRGRIVPMLNYLRIMLWRHMGFCRYGSNFLNLGISWRWVMRFKPLSIYRRRKSLRCPLDKRLVRPGVGLDAVDVPSSLELYRLRCSYSTWSKTEWEWRHFITRHNDYKLPEAWNSSNFYSTVHLAIDNIKRNSSP
jgi:hypothetical protein